MSRACWRPSSCAWENGPPHLKGNISSLINFINCAMFPENKNGKHFSTFHHQKIPRRNSICNVTAWPFMRSKNGFFTRKHFQKVPNPSVISFVCFLLQISSAFAIIFADCHGLSCVLVRASWYTAPSLVFLHGVGPRCVGLTRKISAHCNTGSYVFSFFFIFIFILLLAISHMYVILIPSARSLRFGSRLWKVNIDQNDQNWNLSYYYLFQRTPVIYNFLKRMCFYLFLF